MKQVLVLLAVLWTWLSPSLTCADGIEKWFYAYVDLVRDKVPASDKTNYSTDELIELLPELEQHGYSVIVLSSFQLADDELMDPANMADAAVKVQGNLKRIRAALCDKNMTVIPEVMPVGASESLLQHHRHLAEATPVREMRFHVRRNVTGELLARPDDSNLLTHGDFVGDRSCVAAAWRFQSDNTGLTQSHEAPAGSSSSLQIQFGPDGGVEFPQLNAQHRKTDGTLTKWHPVKPWHQYRLSFAVRTAGLNNPSQDFGFYAEITGRLNADPQAPICPLERVSDSIERTQDWTLYSTMFNTYEFKELQLWIDTKPISEGHAWITNVRLQEIGGANLIRRDDLASTPSQCEALPVTVIVEETKKELKEGTDFAFWEDELVAKALWFQHDHSGTPIRILNDALEGKTLSVSYYHVALPDRNRGSVCCNVRHPQVQDLFRRQISRVHAILQPTRWLINHDEIRAFGHDPLARCDTPAVILRQSLKTCTDIIKATDPTAGIIVFNDMYDPEHNALPKLTLDEQKKKVISYYPMVNGEFFGSGAGMDPNITILNWQTASKSMTKDDDIPSWKRSLTYFNGLGTKQVISGFYDVVPSDADSHQSVRERTRTIFEAAKANGTPPAAVCYYSTKRDHTYTKDFAEIANEIFQGNRTSKLVLGL